MHQNKNQNKQHVPVLLAEVLQYLGPQKGDRYLDLTAGYGGHAKAILERSGSLTSSVLVDRDANAAQELRQQFKGSDLEVRHQDFYSASRELAAAGKQFELILADLGVSSPHLNQAERGFAIASNGPLDMRMDQRQELTAATVVNSYKEADLAALLREYGEEPKANQIAAAIVRARPLQTTDELARVAASAWPGHSRVHPATRTFQALRIAVNDELQQLQNSLPLWIQLLAPGGRLAVISFHSLEDRMVKQALQAAGGNRYDAELRLLTKRPVTPSSAELVFNPRARSAKLRAAVKIKTKGNTNANSGKK
ncbi:MAG TPA: 16S rRNA (cytosine(1402)-N(4))-methyltransferase RsmH [Candidatus Saccharimonadales bacterium]|nr:16S rRNA (cytosine(1402)-N(4))-methyltransferase RsmH [Candidatus Saccharimonadales bacterium]